VANVGAEEADYQSLADTSHESGCDDRSIANAHIPP